jgi:hypothetical protein
MWVRTESEQTQHIHKYTAMTKPSSFFLTKSGKQAQSGFDKYSSVQHTPVDENNALKLQKL